MAIYPKVETDRRIAPADLLDLATRIFAACGMPAADARLLAETLVHSDRRGVHSHGVLRIPDYVGKLTREGVDPRGEPRIVSERGGAIRVDGANTMGQIGGTFAMDRAIAVARGGVGIAFAALGNSNHCGAMDWYTMRASRAGMIGLAGTNALPTMAPVGGTAKVVGINPLSVAMPGDAGTFVLDLAFGATAHGKIRVYDQKGVAIPEGWAFDEDGRPTTDAARAMRGLIQPIGGHKGVALGMMVGMLSSFLSGAGYGVETGNMVDGPTAGRDGQFFVAIDIAAFLDPAEFRARVDGALDEIHASDRREGVERLFVPGDIEAAFELEYDRDGILLAASTLDDVAAAAGELDVDAGILFDARSER